MLVQDEPGWHVSMHSWDRAIWLAAFGRENDLRGKIAVPKDWISHRQQIAIVSTDQVPIWVARQGAGTVFAGHEKVRSSKSSRRSKSAAGSAGEIVQLSERQWSQSLPPVVKELAEARAREGMSQTRSGTGGAGEDEKFRLTLELRHAVLRFFEDRGVPPEYRELPPILVSWGAHARLSNISPDRTWLKTEEFYVGGHAVAHRNNSIKIIIHTRIYG